MNRLGLRSRRGVLAAFVCALALLLVPGLLGESGVPAEESPVLEPLVHEALASPTRAKRRARKLPNVIVITTDDQAQSVYGPRFMPRTFATIGAHPDTARITQALALPPVCCPYRASFLTGQYPHNNGVFANAPGYAKLRDKDNILPVWLQRLGYFTAVAGKYLNGTAATLANQGKAQAPGWDEWFVRTGESNSYFDVEFTDRRPRTRSRRRAIDDIVNPPESTYFTDVVTNRALEFLEERATANANGRRQPFFLWLPHLAPHIGTDLAQGDQNVCSRHRYPSVTNELLAWAQAKINAESEIRRLPSFNEPNISDKPDRVRKHKRFDDEKIATIAQGFECAAAAIHGVDLSNAAIWAKLGELGLRGETIILFGSDNGYYFGEHRYGLKKGVSYEPALRIPMMIKVPSAYNSTGKSPPAKVHSITGQIDLAPTILDYAGAPDGSCRTKTDCRTMDGRSLRAVLGDRARPDIARLGRDSFSGRGMLVERVTPCYWPALRTPRTYFSLYPWNNRNSKPDCGKIRDQEVYDLERDPGQKRNVAGRKAWAKKIRKRLMPRLVELRGCKGVERRDPRHHGRTFCE